jgi:hypothetical protein
LRYCTLKVVFDLLETRAQELEKGIDAAKILVDQMVAIKG